MNKKTFARLLLSGLIAFISYALWAYYANSLVTNDQDILIKAALVQGSYSGGVTLIFTFLLEYFYRKFGSSSYCLAFILPTINAKPTATHRCPTQETFKKSLKISKQKYSSCFPGRLLSPLPALVIQSLFVTSINILFNTPNLLLTIAPSIIFSAIYGYLYSFSLSKATID